MPIIRTDKRLERLLRKGWLITATAGHRVCLHHSNGGSVGIWIEVQDKRRNPKPKRRKACADR